jgi:hypothetical protein
MSFEGWILVFLILLGGCMYATVWLVGRCRRDINAIQEYLSHDRK